MIRRRLFLISITVIIGMVVIGAIVVSACHLASHVERRERAINWLSSRLELTEDQKSKLLSINDEINNLEVEAKTYRGQTKAEIIEMLGSEKLDQDRILAIVDEGKKRVDYFAPKIIAGIADFHKSLSREQRRKLAAQIGRRK